MSQYGVNESFYIFKITKWSQIWKKLIITIENFTRENFHSPHAAALSRGSTRHRIKWAITGIFFWKIYVFKISKWSQNLVENNYYNWKLPCEAQLKKKNFRFYSTLQCCIATVGGIELSGRAQANYFGKFVSLSHWAKKIKKKLKKNFTWPEIPPPLIDASYCPNAVSQRGISRSFAFSEFQNEVKFYKKIIISI